jgi:ATP-dependent RNA helicase DHX29
LDGRQKPGLSPRNGHGTPKRANSPPSRKKVVVVCDSDIEPDDLVPVYLETKSRLFELERPVQETQDHKAPQRNGSSLQQSSNEQTVAKLRAKIERIEKDVLFDKPVAEQQWRAKRVVLEKEYATRRKQMAKTEKPQQPEGLASTMTDDINDEAERIAAEILAEEDDDEGGLADLFASLPVTEVDAATGKTNTVLNGADGSKILIRDFGKWTGVNPGRVLDEACRSRWVAVPGIKGCGQLCLTS